MILQKKLFVCCVLSMLPGCKSESSAPSGAAPTATPAASAPAASTPAASAPTGTTAAPAALAAAAAPAPSTATGAVVNSAPSDVTGPVIEAGCSYDARQLAGNDGTSYQVSCPAGCDKTGYTYGTGVYTADSPICKSGIHSGVIPASGGVVSIKLEAGRLAYRGSEQNGIKSRDYGEAKRSFAVVAPGAAAQPSSVAVAAASATPGVAAATGSAQVIEAGCSYDARQLAGNDGTSYQVACPAGCDKPGSTYGTGVYTADSPICKSGIHSGAIPASGGVVSIKLEAGRPAYRGSEQNTIKSGDYGEYRRSYSVLAPGAAAQPSNTAAAPAAAPPAAAAAIGSAQVIEAGCSYDARQLAGNDGTSYQVACPAGCDKQGSIYGTGVYTGDSSICKSGIHAGAIPAGGGVVSIKLEAGRPAYRGSEQNGIKSRDYGQYKRSFSVAAP